MTKIQKEVKKYITFNHGPMLKEFIMDILINLNVGFQKSRWILRIILVELIII